MNDIRRDLLASLACHAVILGLLLWAGLRAAPVAVEKMPDASEEAARLAAGKTDPAPEKSSGSGKENPPVTTKDAAPEPARTAEEAGKALIGVEAKKGVEMAVPADAPEAVKSELAAAIERALEESLKAMPAEKGAAPSATAIELAVAENVAAQLRREINEAFADSAAKEFSRRAFDSALKNLEKSAAEVLGPKQRELLAAEGAAMAGGDPAQAPRRAADIAINDKDAFQKTLEAEARRVLGEVAPALLGKAAAEIVQKKLDEKGVPADAAAMAKLSAEVGKGVAATAASRGFNAGAVWKPSSELIVPGTRKKKPDEALAAKLGEVAKKQEELIRATLPGLAAEAAKAAKWSDSLGVAKGTDAKIATLHRLETLAANLKAGRGGAAESGLASALATLLGGSGGGNDSALNYDSSGRWSGSGRNFKEDEYRKLLARLEGRPVNAGATADLQRVAGDPVNAASAAGGLLAPARIVSLVPAAPSAVEETPTVIAPPPFPSATHTAARYATKRPVIDGDLSDWNLAGPRAEVRLLESNTHLATGPDVFLQWRAEGLYFAYHLADSGGIQISTGAPYHGDMIELFVDTANSRAPRMRDSNTAHQYFFMPFGYKGDATHTFQRAGGKAEQPAGRDLAALNRGHTVSFCAAKQEPGGYSVEGFLSIEALRRRLAPGIYLGFDVSVSPDFEFKNQMQWAAAKSLGNWERPSTWGDLLLLGTGARLAFRDAAGGERHVAVAGESLFIEVADADMNLDAGARETVAVRIAHAGGGGAQVLLLTETGPDTGIFQGPLLLQSVAGAARPGALTISGGDTVEMTYIDAVNAAGARNQPVTARIEIGWPVMQFGKHTAR